jgi:RNA polymerase sigma-70 factor (ECF subfamily)
LPNEPHPAVNFEDIVREHQSLVFRTLLRLTGSGSHGNTCLEDLAQEVFLRLYRGLIHFEGDAKLSTYLYRIIVNVAQDEWKRRRKDRAYRFTPAEDPDDDAPAFVETLPSYEANAEQLYQREEILEAVDRGLMQLSDQERAVLVLYHQEECNYEHIALTLSLPIGTVRTHLHRGRQKLGDLVKAQTRRPLARAERTA